ncbi:NAD(P)H-dependent glycerol-3-phosphate dehydrogenase [Methylocaldum sp.]|uniref:NAD(P)H-dependent glycerol-3-phosphate dehydrogenase n=1 Tax=Methylocaldum sp. TaxID=1969727 RepID=UPI002D479444|nr:NAD(P)H-dependent glycerol-3-phosphate dehydrogenase [Methylocaldum sp.]HYE35844.1 NAD(P)H-dependent glycerol-3-phosphate dehydrogenase [Methylocaldum sp.]
MTAVSVLGAGSWGTALALLMARNGHPTTLWGHRPEHVAKLHAARCNDRYLPGAHFPDNLKVVANLAEAVECAEILIIAAPSHAFRSLLINLAPHLASESKIAWATKGLELESGKLLHQVTEDVLGPDIPAAVLSGPSFARDLAANLPTAITVASRQVEFARMLAGLLHNNRFRAYTTEDIIGVQLGGATKNVLAIAAGVADGLGFGANSRAALITRGLAEMMRLGLALGGKSETFMGLAGVGDLILTCTDNQSRNRRFGLGLGKGLSREQITAEIGQEIEGITTTKVIYRLAQSLGIEMPITEQTYKILYENLAPLEAVNNLLIREQKSEAVVA